MHKYPRHIFKKQRSDVSQRFVNPGIAKPGDCNSPWPRFGNGTFVVRSRQATSHPHHMIRPPINVTYVDVNPKPEHLQSWLLAIWQMSMSTPRPGHLAPHRCVNLGACDPPPNFVSHTPPLRSANNWGPETATLGDVSGITQRSFLSIGCRRIQVVDQHGLI